jgi:hypothetical protein
MSFLAQSVRGAAPTVRLDLVLEQILTTLTVLARVIPGDALHTAATRNLRKRPGRFLEGGGDSPEICKKLRSDGSTDKLDLPVQGQPLPACNCKEDVQQALDIIKKDFICLLVTDMTPICLRSSGMHPSIGETKMGCIGLLINS